MKKEGNGEFMTICTCIPTTWKTPQYLNISMVDLVEIDANIVIFNMMKFELQMHFTQFP